MSSSNALHVGMNNQHLTRALLRQRLVIVDRGAHSQTANQTTQAVDTSRIQALANHHPLWANPANLYVWIVLGVTLAFGGIGFYDDYLKVTKQTHAGFARWSQQKQRLLALRPLKFFDEHLEYGRFAGASATCTMKLMATR